MNNKMAKSTYLSIIESNISKLSKQEEQRQKSWKQRVFWWLLDGGGVWGNGWTGEGIKKYKYIVTE